MRSSTARSSTTCAANTRRCWPRLPSALLANSDLAELRERLKGVNAELWRIEDEIRLKERAQDFSDEFIALARAVYVVNDRRAALKREINRLSGSALVEEKSYAAY